MKNEKVLEILQNKINADIEEFNLYSELDNFEKRTLKNGDIFHGFEVDGEEDCGRVYVYENHWYYKFIEHENGKLYMIECEKDGTLLTYGAKITEYHSLNDHKVQELKDFISDLYLV